MSDEAPDRSNEDQESRARLLALTDGVFAIAMTLLTVELALPASAEHSSRFDLLSALFSTWPRVFAYVQSFSILAIFWLGNHRMFRLIRRVDRPYSLLYLGFLLFIAFLPYPTSVFGTHFLDPVGLLFYNSMLFLTSCAGWLAWWYAARHALLAPEVTARKVRHFHRLFGGAPVMFLLLSLVNLWDLLAGAGRAPLIVSAGIAYLIAVAYFFEHMHESWEPD